MRVPLHLLLIQPDEPPMYLPAVESLVNGTRTDERPVEVVAVPGTPHFRITNGRHRFMAAVARALPDIECVLADSQEEVPHAR